MPYWDQLIRQVETVLEKWHDKDGGTQKDYDDYTKALEKATIKHQGEIIDFVNTFFGGTKAIIEGTDRKLYRVNINNLKVIEKYD